MNNWKNKDPMNWSALDISKAYSDLEEKAKKKRENLTPLCGCGEELTNVDNNLHCWRCHPADE